MPGCVAHAAMYLAPIALVLGALVWWRLSVRSQAANVQHLMPDLEPLLEETPASPHQQGARTSNEPAWPLITPQSQEEQPRHIPWHTTHVPLTAPLNAAEQDHVFQTMYTDLDIELPIEPAPVEPTLHVLEQSMLCPALQKAQDNLNHQLWHQLLWQIPNAQWLHTYHQSLVEVKWLCLGPDLRRFIAHAHLRETQWVWSFTQA